MNIQKAEITTKGYNHRKLISGHVVKVRMHETFLPEHLSGGLGLWWCSASFS